MNYEYRGVLIGLLLLAAAYAVSTSTGIPLQLVLTSLRLSSSAFVPMLRGTESVLVGNQDNAQ